MLDALHGPVFCLLLTLACYRLGEWAYRHSNRFPLCHPFIVALGPLTWVLFQLQIDFETYLDYTQVLHFLLGPATVALAWPLYKQLNTIGANWRALLATTLFGALFAMLAAVLIAAWFNAPAEVLSSLAPKSITTPIALELAKHTGGFIALVAAAVAFTGIFGAVVTPPILDALGITDQRVRGFTLGLVAHAIGTAKAFEESEQAGAFASLALSLTGLATAIALPWLWPVLRAWLAP